MSNFGQENLVDPAQKNVPLAMARGISVRLVTHSRCDSRVLKVWIQGFEQLLEFMSAAVQPSSYGAIRLP